MLTLDTKTDQTGQVTLSGSLTRQEEKDAPVSAENPHLINVGRMIEEMENRLRQTIETIYFGKTKDIANELRQAVSVGVMKHQQEASKKIGNAIRS